MVRLALSSNLPRAGAAIQVGRGLTSLPLPCLCPCPVSLSLVPLPVAAATRPASIEDLLQGASGDARARVI
eukprot:3090362-Rhodomonas_salina.1